MTSSAYRLSVCRRSGAAPISDDTLPILFEDEHLLIVDKPAGLACHGGSGIAFGLIERLRASRPNQPFLELAHRLDRDTSGAIIVCKSRKALVRLQKSMREGGIEKHYRTLVKGDWVNDRQHVKLPLFKYVTKEGERKSNILPAIPAGSTVSAPRTMIQYVATEYGVVSLPGKSLRERAEAMASIAHPDFREELLRYAREHFA